MAHLHDIIIVGGGPVGLGAALEAQRRGYDFLLLESRDRLGGQLTELYPEKEIIDIPGVPPVLAKDYIAHLLAQFIDGKTRLLTDVKVVAITPDSAGVSVKTDTTTYASSIVIIATGLGVYMPRLLECHGSEGCRNIIYALHRLDFLAGKRVAILGGGDAALDWARDISRHTPHVTLVHRRHEFRGDMSVIANIKTLNIKTPYVPVEVNSHADIATRLVIEHVETKMRTELEVDYIFVNYGHIPVGASFGLEKAGPGLKVDTSMRTSSQRIYGAGDIVGYPNKKRRIDAGLAELKILFEASAPLIRR